MNSPADISSMLLREGDLSNHPPAFDSLCADCIELIKLLATSVKTAKENT